jgi:hypothetical protein
MAGSERHHQEGQEGAGYGGHPAKGSTRGRTEQKGLAAPHRPWELCCAVVGVGGGEESRRELVGET